jgi:alpha-1,2-glucosyltransferase
MAYVCRNMMEAGHGHRQRNTPQGFSFYALHMSLNVALFPALFFFSALFYTDVWSTVFVLFAYCNHLQRTTQLVTPSVPSDLLTVFLGIVTLFMRQTNVFWVVVYMGGLEVVHAVRSLKPEAVRTPQPTTLVNLVRFYSWRYSLGDVHDPPLHISWPDGKTLSLVAFGQINRRLTLGKIGFYAA